MRVRRDSDLMLVESMLAPPPLEDARSSLEFWQRRHKALPLYKRGARKEAREMTARWEERVAAAERARFEQTPAGRLLAAIGLLRFVPFPLRPTKGWVLAFAWAVVPRQAKLVAGGVVAAWLVVLAATLMVVAAAVNHL
jgi:hypothetical protein